MKKAALHVLLALLVVLCGRDAWCAGTGDSAEPPLEGTYRLRRIKNETGGALEIPAGTTLSVKPKAAAANSTRSGSEQYDLHVSIQKGTDRGNRLWGTATVDTASTSSATAGASTTTIGPIFSTRMDTKFLSYERLLSSMLSSTNGTTVLNNGVLRLSGSKGLLKFRRAQR
jgi:hypothetical protein